MNPADFNTLKSILKAEGFDFKKSLGQNFLIDSTVCPMMAEASCDEQTGVLEIGPGAGVLTAQLCDKAKKVVAVELDERLRPVLAKTLKDKTNVEIIFGDAMKLDLAGLIKEKFSDCKRVAVCANSCKSSIICANFISPFALLDSFAYWSAVLITSKRLSPNVCAISAA